MLRLLSRAGGATIATIMTSTGWQPHTVRGFFAAVVRRAAVDKIMTQALALAIAMSTRSRAISLGCWRASHSQRHE